MHRPELTDTSTPLPPIVLVVDDHADTVEMYETLLSAQGYWVARATNASDAFEYAHDVLPDAIVTDLGLPGEMDGAELIRQLRADPTLRDVPILAVTGRDPRDVPSLSGLKMLGLLLKPVAPETLIARVQMALEHSAALRTRSAAAVARVEPLLAKSAGLVAQAHQHRRTAESSRTRACPGCGQDLEWIESGALNGIEYDYYRWCAGKCGLYCFNNTTHKFELLSASK
jgi:DNA-binding response OmpR family regulator